MFEVDRIKSIAPEHLLARGVLQLARDKKSYVCPKCGNGTGKRGDGITSSYVNGAWLYHCFSCNTGYDNIALLANFYGLDTARDFIEICERACAEFGVTVDDNYIAPPKLSAEEIENKRKEKELIKADIAAAQNNLENLPVKARRGLNLKTLGKFGCGYLKDWKSPKSRLNKTYSTPTPRLIIPTGNTHYLARLIVPLETFDEKSRQFIKEKPHAGDKLPFGVEFITSTTKTIIVVEGEIDAMSIDQALNNPAITPIATSGAAVSEDIGNKIFAALDAVFANAEKPNVLILFDNDKAGKTNAPKLCEKFIQRGYAAVVDYLSSSDEKVDANSILQDKGEGEVSELITLAIETARDDFKSATAKIKSESALREKISEWEQLHGKISLETLQDLQKAAEYLSTLKIENSAVVNESKTVHAVALCQYYDFYRQVAENFIARVTAAKIAIGIKTFKENVAKEITQIKRRHAAHLKQAEQFQARENFQHTQKSSELKRGKILEQLKELQKQPSTAERNSEMQRLILEACEWQLNKFGKKLFVKAAQKNYDLIFSFDPVLDGLFAYDEFKAVIVLLKKPYWRKHYSTFDRWSDDDDACARVYLRRTYADIYGENVYLDNVRAYAHIRSFNVVRDFFESLPAWDKISRAENLFIDFLKVEDSPYTRAVTLKWLLAAVARIFYPACTFQAALVLQGNQNIGKSYILERLGGNWYGCLIDSVDDIHAVDSIKQLWLVELKEMAAARKSEINATKAFIERAADTYRAAYARHAETFKRHCVFAITVNDKQFLRDLTGNRRYWILESPLEEFGYIEGLTDEVIKQIWAEVFFKFKELTAGGFNDKILELPLEFKQQAEIIAKRFTADDGLQSEIAAFLDIPIPPLVVWNLLTFSEKKKFFAQNFIALADGDWSQRRKTLKTDDEKATFDYVLENARHIEIPRGRDSTSLEIAVYGKYIRQETCASEIYNEYFFGGDKRKQIYRITEALDNLEDWELLKGGDGNNKRSKNFNGYGYQRKIYRRIVPAVFEEPTNDYEVETVDLPF